MSSTRFSFKTYYNRYISPTTNSVWGVVSVTANELSQRNQQGALISLMCDVSGSMQGAKFNNAIATCERLIQNAPSGIGLQVVLFDDSADEVLPMTAITDETDRMGLVNVFRQNSKKVRMFGGTAFSTGVNAAVEAQGRLYGTFARYGIFLTDGQNMEDENKLIAAVQDAAGLGIHLCAYGYGTDWQPAVLTKMAEATKGWMPKAVPNPQDLGDEFNALVGRMARTVASDVVLNLWTPTGARILSLSQAYPNWVKGEAAPQGDDHTWVVPVPPMAANDHRDFVVHIELAQVGAKVVACKPSVVYVSGTERVQETGDQSTWIILEQTRDSSLSSDINPVVAGYLGQGQLADATRAMTDALARGDGAAAERHRTEALELSKATGNRQMTDVLEASGAGSEVARKTAALGTSTVSLTEE